MVAFFVWLVAGVFLFFLAGWLVAGGFLLFLLAGLLLVVSIAGWLVTGWLVACLKPLFLTVHLNFTSTTPVNPSLASGKRHLCSRLALLLKIKAAAVMIGPMFPSQPVDVVVQCLWWHGSTSSCDWLTAGSKRAIRLIRQNKSLCKW